MLLINQKADGGRYMLLLEHKERAWGMGFLWLTVHKIWSYCLVCKYGYVKQWRYTKKMLKIAGHTTMTIVFLPHIKGRNSQLLLLSFQYMEWQFDTGTYFITLLTPSYSVWHFILAINSNGMGCLVYGKNICILFPMTVTGLIDLKNHKLWHSPFDTHTHWEQRSVKQSQYLFIATGHSHWSSLVC